MDEGLRLHNLKPAPGSRKDRKRVGRGKSSGGNKTAGRGQKGQKSRSGFVHKRGFEGGQMPLVRRVPKLGGFKPRTRKVYQVVNVRDFDRFEAASTVDPAAMAASGLVKKDSLPIKVLGDGEIAVSLTVKAQAFTASAKAKIEAAGGSAEVI